MTASPTGHNGGPSLYDDSGWVAIARASRSHPVVGWHIFVPPADPTRGALQPGLAWYDLIMECRYMDGTVNNNGHVMTLRRGQMLGATAWLADRWNWSSKTVRVFLERLEENKMIACFSGEDADTDDQKNKGNKSRRIAKTISVCNYDVYQIGSVASKQPQGQYEGNMKGSMIAELSNGNRSQKDELPKQPGQYEGQYAQKPEIEQPISTLTSGSGRFEGKENINENNSLDKGNTKGNMKGNMIEDLSVGSHSTNNALQEQPGQYEGQYEGQYSFSAVIENAGDKRNKVKQKEKKDNPQPPIDSIAGDFEIWWRAYPNSIRKVAKGECMALFRQAVTGRRRATKHGPQKILEYGLATSAQLIDAIHAYAATGPDPTYIPAPATWLNGGRWLDAPKPVTIQPGASAESKRPKPYWWRGREATVRDMGNERWTKAINAWANGVWPEDVLGPVPGSPDCMVPQSIIDEMGLLQKYGQRPISTTGTASKH